MSLQRFSIRIDGAADGFVCRSDEAVIDAYERAVGLGQSRAMIGKLPVGCRRGGCGVCRVQVLSGPWTHEPMSRAHVPEALQAEGYALACRLIPQGDLLLRVATPEQVLPPSKKQTETV